MSRKSYVQIGGKLYDKSLPLPEGVEAPQGKTATVLNDLGDFVSPIDGKTYSGRAGLRDHCARHSVVPTAELKGLPPKPANQPYQPDSAGIRDAIRRAVYK
jgi:hypothetical protein